MDEQLERRFHETRYDQERRAVSGYAAVFYDGTPSTEFQIGPNVWERIHPDAFDASMTSGRMAGKLRLCRMHDRSQILASEPKTLQLRKDNRGLAYDASLPDTTIGRDTAAELGSGLLTGASVGMDLRKADVRYTKEGSRTIATVHRASLNEISLVDMPAYESCSAVLRWADSFKETSVDEVEDFARELLHRASAKVPTKRA